MKRILIFFVLILTVAGIVLAGVYFTRIQTMSTIKKESSYEGDYNLYSMTVKYDYDIDAIIAAGFTDTKSFSEAVIKEALPLLPIQIDVPSFGCSAYRAVSTDGDSLMGRNYDFKLDTSCMLVRCAPKNGYRSIAFAALNNIGADHADDGLAARLSCLTAPFVCLDGVNEKGVSIAVLTLDSAPTDQSTGRQKIATCLAIRLVLDRAATTQEAVELLRQYDMLATNGRDYHFFISDASGDSRTVEYDPLSQSRVLVDTPIQAITNFYAMYIDQVAPNQKNGVYGHGKERYDSIMTVLDRCGGVLTNGDAWEALQSAATEPNPENVTSNTQWSIVYNNTALTADLVFKRHWGDVFSFRLD